MSLNRLQKVLINGISMKKSKVCHYGWCFVIVVIVFLIAGCHPGVQEEVTQKNPMVKMKSQNHPAFLDSLDFNGLSQSIDNSLVYFKRVPLDRMYTYGKDGFTAAHMIVSLETFKAFFEKEPSAKELAGFIRQNYFVYTAAGNQDKQVLFTGYFEPTYAGSLEKTDTSQYPVYSKPKDMLEIDLSLFSDKYKGHRRLIARANTEQQKVLPYYSRKQINEIDDFWERATPVAWLKSRTDRFFLEIQGSGRIDIGDGEIVRVHYAGSNGNAYRSIGRYLIDQNEILKDQMSMQAIRTWLDFHPKRMDEVLHYNESMVFFTKEEGGPYGSIGVQVTPFRSIATDSRLFPKGALCFVDAQLPDRVNVNPIKEWERTSFFVLNQDTGGAIKGPARADIFCGNDNYASFTAGHMKEYGHLYFLVLKP